MKLHRGRGYFVISTARHDKIGRQGGSGTRPSIVPTIEEKIIAGRLFLHIRALSRKKAPVWLTYSPYEYNSLFMNDIH
ncbi:hypothetical protein ANACOL_04104 [Anaerotruncus colihominis DSM 17241]|uniref:Uncharacterized protein n=1 Tax=Anaerotruncus colihominis DSM 17241 TaxID=445972 RepID=B0PH82_9FIRM|nr:hypothetical protein ANACOL_04104 [Anaerotruncus colihominis DSM 17241]